MDAYKHSSPLWEEIKKKQFLARSVIKNMKIDLRLYVVSIVETNDHEFWIASKIWWIKTVVVTQLYVTADNSYIQNKISYGAVLPSGR
jgi:hypothetical protein